MGEFSYCCLLPQRSNHPREMVITPKASTSIYVKELRIDDPPVAGADD